LLLWRWIGTNVVALFAGFAGSSVVLG
jgi:hypothetical protein